MGKLERELEWELRSSAHAKLPRLVLPPGVVQTNQHELGGLPCLCKNCFDGTTVTNLHGAEFVLDFAHVGRVAFLYWLPGHLLTKRAEVREKVAKRLALKAQ